MTARERFESLYSEHGGAVLAYARRRTSAANAEDVLAEVFMTAWRRLEEIPPDARVWLFGVARRVLANQRRGAARQTALHGRLTVENERISAAEGSGDGRVLRALASLSESDQEVLLLLGWEGLGNREAARVLGIRAGTFAVRLHRARAHFANALAPALQIPSPAGDPAEPGQTMEAR